MFRAVIQIDDKEYKFEDEEHDRTSIVIYRDPKTKEFPLLELYFEQERPKQRELYRAYVGVEKKILEYAVFEYEMVKGICYYPGYLEFDINEYKLSDNKDEIEVVIDFE